MPRPGNEVTIRFQIHSRLVKDIRLGRTYRKRTNPMPVYAPVKSKSATTTSEQSDADTEDIETVTKVNEKKA